jgi:hypothetical protein
MCNKGAITTEKCVTLLIYSRVMCHTHIPYLCGVHSMVWKCTSKSPCDADIATSVLDLMISVDLFLKDNIHTTMKVSIMYSNGRNSSAAS